ncbi:tetrapyrrole methylase [Mrakia frigida]|uniref:uroporphyrinogen-III C-methyltransferase n=1 Tax=Mrakia frigida TaxID=29902 RepID=UPI003FCBFEBF
MASTSTQSSPFPTPSGSASLLLSFTPKDRSILVLGSSRIAASRAFLGLDANARVVVSSSSGLDSACDEIKWRVERKEIDWLDIEAVSAVQEESSSFWEETFGALGRDLALVCVTDAVLDASTNSTTAKPRRSLASIKAIRSACVALRLPVNISDHPALSDFSFPSSHRFALDPSSSSEMSTLQIAVSTSGRGCRLATRIKREIVARLPRAVGGAVENVGRMREKARLGASAAREGEARRKTRVFLDVGGGAGEEDLSSTPHIPLNSPVRQLDDSYVAAAQLVEEEEEETKRRMRWVAQVSEYWPIEYLAGLKEPEMDQILGRYASKGIVDEGFSETVDGGGDAPQESNTTSLSSQPSSSTTQSSSTTSSSANNIASSSSTFETSPIHSISIRPPSPPPSLPPKGVIHLLGSGPGHPSLLTIAAHKSLLTATLVLSDKLVPAEILALIPSTTTLHIAKKFPGNAEGAQNEMMALALEGARRGERVVRLKQGDPYIYGRGGEEVLFFREHGFESVVVPGVSSALAGPLMFGVPVTQRGVAESMVLCTGVGRKGKAVQLPGYERSRTLLVLMGVARLNSVLQVLQQPSPSSSYSDSSIVTTTTTFSSSLTPNPTSEPSAPIPSAFVSIPATSSAGVSYDIGSRLGAAYPPWTPIAIIERASSTDQRMVASTLSGIAAALERVGDQRPPGMMVIGWSVLALEGKGDVGVLDDGEQGEEADRARVRRWLGGDEGGFIVREGLRDEWKEFL